MEVIMNLKNIVAILVITIANAAVAETNWEAMTKGCSHQQKISQPVVKVLQSVEQVSVQQEVIKKAGIKGLVEKYATRANLKIAGKYGIGLVITAGCVFGVYKAAKTINARLSNRNKNKRK